MPSTKGSPSLCCADFDVLQSWGGTIHTALHFLFYADLPSPLITPSPSLQPASLAEARVRFPLHGEPGCFSSHGKDLKLVPARPPFPGGRNCICHPNSLHRGSCEMSKVILHSQLVFLSFGHCCGTMTPCTAWRGMGLQIYIMPAPLTCG